MITFFSKIQDPTGRCAMLNLVLINKEGLLGNVKFKGSLHCIDHEIVETKVLRAVRRKHSKLFTLHFRRTDFGLFRDLFGRVLWDKARAGKREPRKLVNIKASPPSRSGGTHPDKEQASQKSSV